MNNVDFNSLTKELIDESINKIMKAKGSEYAGDEDRLANFKRGAKNLGLEPETILMVYMSKHQDSINSYVRRVQETGNSAWSAQLSEPIRTRIQDNINYLLLLYALIVERSGKEALSRSGYSGTGATV